MLSSPSRPARKAAVGQLSTRSRGKVRRGSPIRRVREQSLWAVAFGQKVRPDCDRRKAGPTAHNHFENRGSPRARRQSQGGAARRGPSFCVMQCSSGSVRPISANDAVSDRSLRFRKCRWRLSGSLGQWCGSVEAVLGFRRVIAGENHRDVTFVKLRRTGRIDAACEESLRVCCDRPVSRDRGASACSGGRL